GAMVDVDCCSIRLSYFYRSGRADLNHQPTVPITHNLRPAEITTDKRRTGNTCSTTELLRRVVPKAGLEPATTRLGGDNPILRPVESASAPPKDGQETASMLLDGNRTRIFSFSQDALTQLSYPVR